MGCRKITYYQAGEANGQTAFFSGGGLEKKGVALKNRYNYYPFGLTFNSYQRSYSKANNYKYNGKEEQEETGWIDYGARMYQPDLGRWNGVDNLSEKYSAYSPYNYTLNNPILFIDPDGNDVVVNHLSENRKKAFAKYMSTASGRAYVSQFLKEGEKVQGYDFTATSNGRYSNSTLQFGQTNLGSGLYGLTRTYHKNSDGSKGDILIHPQKTVGKKDVDQLSHTQSFEINIFVNSTKERSESEWADTFGHEVFIHAVDNSNTIQSVIDKVKNGASIDEVYDMVVQLQNEGTNAQEEHDRADRGEDKDYNRYKEELKEKDE